MVDRTCIAALTGQPGAEASDQGAMGGMIALTLTHGNVPATVKWIFAFGVKAAWTDAELAKLKLHAQAPAKRFDNRAEVADRFLRVSGLKNLVDTDASTVEAGIAKDEAGYRLAADPRTAMVAGTSLQEAFRGSNADRRLACGSKDALVTIAQLRAIDPAAIDPAAISGLTGTTSTLKIPTAYSFGFFLGGKGQLT